MEGLSEAEFEQVLEIIRKKKLQNRSDDEGDEEYDQILERNVELEGKCSRLESELLTAQEKIVQLEKQLNTNSDKIQP